MLRLIVTVILAGWLQGLAAQKLLTQCEATGGRETFRYEEGIAFCRSLDSLSPYLRLFEYGTTDAGYPLHLLVFDADRNFNPVSNKEVILINNAIHPGEPDGVEASLMLARDLASQVELRKAYRNARILIIPFFNIGGALNRNSHSRANQDGPNQYGFRGNARNYDLNRDFIKADAENTFAFYTIFHTWKPSVLVDTHVSNGADYQYTMTLIATQEEKYGPSGSQVQDLLVRRLFHCMDSLGEAMTPYVNVFGTVPDSGFSCFNETPRYSNGYAALFGCLSFVAETHMLKPFDKRVAATRALLDQIILLSIEYRPSEARNRDRLRRQEELRGTQPSLLCLSWESAEGQADYVPDSILFRGYTAGMKPSEVSGLPRLYYDRNKPFTKRIPYHDKLIPVTRVPAARAYVIPAAWKEVARRLAANGVHFDTLKSAQQFVGFSGRIAHYETEEQVYEGHYLHSKTQVDWHQDTVFYNAGDLLVSVTAENELFLASVLVPEAPDSYFNWNFFDPILQQKEWFSSYVFEDIAAEILRKDPQLREVLEARKAQDPEFAKSAFLQLYFVYRHSPYYETSHMRYPVLILPY